MRPKPQGDLRHLVGRRHLQVERQSGRRHDRRDIFVANMAAILAQMRGDSVGPGQRRRDRGANRIGVQPASGVPQGRDMIDIDAEARY
jgi:hypothetical protein